MTHGLERSADEMDVDELLRSLRSAILAELARVKNEDPSLRDPTLSAAREAVRSAAMGFNASRPLPRIGEIIVSTTLVEFFKSRNLESFLSTLRPNCLFILDAFCELLQFSPQGVLRADLMKQVAKKIKKHNGVSISPETFRTAHGYLGVELRKIGLEIQHTKGGYHSRRYLLVGKPCPEANLGE